MINVSRKDMNVIKYAASVAPAASKEKRTDESEQKGHFHIFNIMLPLTLKRVYAGGSVSRWGGYFMTSLLWCFITLVNV